MKKERNTTFEVWIEQPLPRLSKRAYNAGCRICRGRYKSDLASRKRPVHWGGNYYTVADALQHVPSGRRLLVRTFYSGKERGRVVQFIVQFRAKRQHAAAA